MANYDYHAIAQERASRPSCRMTAKRRATIEADLKRFIQVVSQIVNGVEVILDKDVDYANVKQVRTAILEDKVFPAPLMENRFIDDEVYSLYRAYHDILHHALMGLGFDWQGESMSYELATKLLKALNCSEECLAFICDDILQRNAMYHAYKGKVPAKEQRKLCLKPLRCISKQACFIGADGQKHCH